MLKKRDFNVVRRLKKLSELKKYLADLPKLVSPITRETLYLYVNVSVYSLSTIHLAERESE